VRGYWCIQREGIGIYRERVLVYITYRHPLAVPLSYLKDRQTAL